MTEAPRHTARPVGSPELVWDCGARRGNGRPGITTSTPGRRCSHGCKKCFAPCGNKGCGTSCVQCGRQWAASGVGWATSIFRGDGVVVHASRQAAKL